MCRKTSRFGVVLVAALWGASGCDDATVSDETVAFDETVQANVVSTFNSLSLCPPRVPLLVCDVDGRTFRDLCSVGGLSRVAHLGACPDFVCNGALCAPGFSCHSSGSNTLPLDRCVADPVQ